MQQTAKRYLARANPIGVDKEAKAVRGYVVAQKGPFKTPGRGEFDDKSLKAIVRLMNETDKGVPSRFGHRSFFDDQPGKYLGRVKDARLDGDRVRADLFLSDAAFSSPFGNLGTWLMTMVSDDPGAISSSLVLRADDEIRVDAKGKPKVGEDGDMLPPLWRPVEIFGSDIVEEGDAVHDGILSSLPHDELLERALHSLRFCVNGMSRQEASIELAKINGELIVRLFGEKSDASRLLITRYREQREKVGV